MKHDKKVLVLSILTAAAMTVTSPLQVMAENPEFAHDEATWARLRDNVMEYDELQMLVEEYNPTYMNNQVSYKDSRTKDDAETVRQDLKDAADDMTSQAEDMRDTADSLLDLANSLQNMSKEQADAVLKQAGINSVNSLMSSYNAMYLGAAMMDNSAMKQNISADSQYDDDESRKLKYQKTQNGLIMSVQTMFASYNQMKSSLDVIQKKYRDYGSSPALYRDACLSWDGDTDGYTDGQEKRAVHSIHLYPDPYLFGFRKTQVSVWPQAGSSTQTLISGKCPGQI